jgi:hypothetical protein
VKKHIAHSGAWGLALIVVASWLLYRCLAPKTRKEWASAGMIQAIIIVLYPSLGLLPDGDSIPWARPRRCRGRSGQSKIRGVDLSEAMLNEARVALAAHGWSNVELVNSDPAACAFPSAVDGMLSTFAITLVPEFDEVIR